MKKVRLKVSEIIKKYKLDWTTTGEVGLEIEVDVDCKIIYVANEEERNLGERKNENL